MFTLNRLHDVGDGHVPVARDVDVEGLRAALERLSRDGRYEIRRRGELVHGFDVEGLAAVDLEPEFVDGLTAAASR